MEKEPQSLARIARSVYDHNGERRRDILVYLPVAHNGNCHCPFCVEQKFETKIRTGQKGVLVIPRGITSHDGVDYLTWWLSVPLEKYNDHKIFRRALAFFLLVVLMTLTVSASNPGIDVYDVFYPENIKVVWEELKNYIGSIKVSVVQSNCRRTLFSKKAAGFFIL